MFKDIYEDVQRHRSDSKENNNEIQVCKKTHDKDGHVDTKFGVQPWREINVGDIIRVEDNSYFPCDVLLINSSLPKGICYVETKNLDGETNLKQKTSPKDCLLMSQSDTEVMKAFDNCIIDCEPENEFLYTFNGSISLPSQEGGDNRLVPLDVENICLRGSSLRNTEWVYAVAIYTGHETKVMMNSTQSKPKFSKIEKSTNHYIVFAILVQFGICLVSAFLGYYLLDDKFTYLDIHNKGYDFPIGVNPTPKGDDTFESTAG